MSFWRDVKRGAGYGLGGGFGGRIGWELGGLVWRLMRRAALALMMIAGGSLAHCQHGERMAAQRAATMTAPAKAAKQSTKTGEKSGGNRAKPASLKEGMGVPAD